MAWCRQATSHYLNQCWPSSLTHICGTLRLRQNGWHFTGDIFKCFSWTKLFEFWLEFHWILSPCSTWQYASIGSANGLVPNRRQAIFCTIDDLGQRCIYASLGLNELRQGWVHTFCSFICMQSHFCASNIFTHFLYPRPVLAFGYCRCLRLCVCVCLSVCMCVNHEFVRAITLHPFKLESPNLEHRCKTPWLRSVLFCVVIDLTFKVKFHLKVEFYIILSLSGR